MCDWSRGGGGRMRGTNTLSDELGIQADMQVESRSLTTHTLTEVTTFAGKNILPFSGPESFPNMIPYDLYFLTPDCYVQW